MHDLRRLLRLHRTLLPFCAAVALVYSVAGAQPTGGTKLPSFDVVSVKPNKTGSGGMHISNNNGTFSATNITLKTLLLNAYSLKEAQLIGLPGWGESAHFDIEAKVLDPDVLTGLTEQQWGSMLGTVLADRFGLKSHRETAMLPVYELVLAKSGAKLKPSESKFSGSSSRNTELTATRMDMRSLCYRLSSELQRIVVDKTELTGYYDFTLKWTREDAPPSDNAPPPLFTAIQEQLGLKLMPAKAPVETFVVDHVEMPSEN